MIFARRIKTKNSYKLDNSPLFSGLGRGRNEVQINCRYISKHEITLQQRAIISNSDKTLVVRAWYSDVQKFSHYKQRRGKFSSDISTFYVLAKRRNGKVFFSLFTFAVALASMFLSTKQEQVSIHSFIVHICISLLTHRHFTIFLNTSEFPSLYIYVSVYVCVCVGCLLSLGASSWRLISFVRA